MIEAFIQRKQYQSAIALLAIIGFVVAVLNWPHEQVQVRYGCGHELAFEHSASDQFSLLDYAPVGRAVGWPVAISLDGAGSGQPANLRSAVGLNVAAAVGLCVLTFAFALVVQSLLRFQSGSATTFDKRQLGLATIPLACFLAAMAVFASEVRQQSLVERSFVKRLVNYGAVERTTVVPKFLYQRLPSHWLLPFTRIASYRVTSAPSDLIANSLQHDSIRNISVEDVSVDDQLWSELINSTTLDSLRFDYCDFLVENAIAAGPHTSLRSLTLYQCWGSESMTDSIPSMTSLESLSLNLSPISRPQTVAASLPADLKDLRLTISATDATDLRFHDLRKLEILKLDSSTNTFTDDVAALDLRDLPQLTSVTISPWLRMNISAVSVPRLQSIAAGRAFRHRGDVDDRGPESLRVCRLSIQQAPCLQELRLAAECLESFAIEQTPNFRSLVITPPRWFQNQALAVASSDDETSANQRRAVSRWMEDLATCDGPVSVDLSGLRMTGVDLTSLRNNSRIRALILTNTGVRASELVAIGHGNRIKSLKLQGCQIDHDELQSLLTAFKGIERLLIDTDNLEQIEIVDQPQLTDLFGSSVRSARRVKIVGCPKLTGNLAFGNGLESLEIRDGLSLKSLTVKGLLPPNAVLSGLRDLEIVELSGRNFNEQHFAALLECKSLSELSLAMPSVSAASLQRLGELEAMMVLRLPGANLTDEVVSQWGALTMLREVDLSFTRVSGQSLRMLSAHKNIQRLCVNHTQVQSSEIPLVSQIDGLLEIEFAGIGISPDDLRLCLRPSTIDRINLSGVAVGAELVDVLASDDANHLLFAGLRRCKLLDDDVRRIATAHPQLAMDIEGNWISDSLVRELAAQGRLISCNDRLEFERYLQQLAGNSVIADWLATKKARFEFGTRPYASLQVLPPVVERGRSSRSPIRSLGWMRRNVTASQLEQWLN